MRAGNSKKPGFQKPTVEETGNFSCQFPNFFKQNPRIFSQFRNIFLFEAASVETFISVV
jgi:hypothetical protein